MAKFIPYDSPLAFLARKFYFINQLRSLYFKYNKFDGKLRTVARDPRPKRSPYFLGGLNPLLAMGKDFVDTFKPYKSAYYVQKDLLQPFRGLGNIVRGVFNIIATPLIFLVNTVRYSAMAIQQRNFALYTGNMARGSVKAGGGLLDGVSSIIRGATQIVSTPLTWLLRMQLRRAITAVQGKPTVSQNLEKRIVILEALIKKEGKSLEETICIDRGLSSIKLKAKKALRRGQKIGAKYGEVNRRFHLCKKFTAEKTSGEWTDFHDEDQVFPLCDSESARVGALHFLSLFSKAHTVQESNAGESNTYSVVES